MRTYTYRKITPEMITQMQALLATGKFSQSDIHRMTGISRTSIRKHCGSAHVIDNTLAAADALNRMTIDPKPVPTYETTPEANYKKMEINVGALFGRGGDIMISKDDKPKE